MEKLKYFIILFLVFTVSCENEPDSFVATNVPADIFPDYNGVTIPQNISPLNISLKGDVKDVWIRVEGKGNKFSFKAKSDKINIPIKKWRSLLESSVNDSVKISIVEKNGNAWQSLKPIVYYVSGDPIDEFLAYRLIPPGYELWNEMGIYQVDLTNSKQKAIFENKLTEYNCVNCHSFCSGNPEKMMFHLRGRNGGTFISNNNKYGLYQTKLPDALSSFVYPYWHPSGNFIAFSENKTMQTFHGLQQVEVFDNASNIIVYDVNENKVLKTPSLSSTDKFETFPTFSPDGKTLYFCQATAKNMPDSIGKVRYNLCSISFDENTKQFGSKIDTVYLAEKENKSALFPRISPDGKYLMFTICDFGTFPIWHKEADINIVNLENGEIDRLENVNSDDAESYHSWSSNGRWFVFSSRRTNGLYTQPFLCHMSDEGIAGKPFLLPQVNVNDFYNDLMKSYNIPEFVKKQVKLNYKEIYEIIDGKSTKSVK